MNFKTVNFKTVNFKPRHCRLTDIGHSPASVHNTARTWLLCMLCLWVTPGVRAQTPAADACLAEGNFSHYSPAEVKTLQTQLGELYPQAASGAEGRGRLQPDGRLGPITLTWLQRFCEDFALNQNLDLQHSLPARLAQLHLFAAQHRQHAQILTSAEFTAWASQYPLACKLDVRGTLASGTDAELLQLASCYISPEPAAIQIPPPQSPAFYVLQTDDPAKFAEALLTNEADSESLTAAIEAVFEPLFGIQYPTDTLLHRAIQAELLAVGVTSLSDQLQAALQPRLLQLSTAAKGRYCPQQDHNALPEKYDLTWRAHIDKLARKDLPKYEPQTLTWQSSDCKCVPPQIHTTGYGIYPYWQSEGKPELFDFSVFSRVAYYGLTADNSGELRHLGATDHRDSLLTNHSAASKAFIETARRHGSQVDWVVEKDWLDFQQAESPELEAQQFFKNLTAKLLQFLSHKLTQPGAEFRSWLTLGAAPHPRNGDGITLYLKNYPTSETARLEFNQFFKDLQAELKKNDDRQNRWRTYRQNTYLNLLVDQESFLATKGAFSSSNILKPLEEEDVDTHDSMLYIQAIEGSLALVLLESPHGDSLDLIYNKTTTIERALIVPTFVAPTQNIHKKSERDNPLARNITYVQESFGGVGFWPITVNQKPYVGFNTYIADRFADIDSTSVWTSTLCHHRWLLLGILNIWLLVTFIYLLGVFYLSPHHCRSLPRPLAWLPHPVTVVLMLAPPIGLWLYLLLADPLFGMLNVTGLLVLVIVALALWAGSDAIKVLRRPLPNRGLLRQLNRLRSQHD